MVYLKIASYFCLILIIQTVLFLWLNIFTYVPDLWLVSVVIVAVFQARQPATSFALAAGLLQDIFSAGPYFNTMIKVVVCNIVSSITDEFVGDEYLLVFGLIAVITPCLIVLEVFVKGVVTGLRIDWLYYLLKIILTTMLNLAAALLLIPVLKRVLNERK